ncbi:Cell shape-determining protein MreC [Alphaproteobacteria bacterium]
MNKRYEKVQKTFTFRIISSVAIAIYRKLRTLVIVVFCITFIYVLNTYLFVVRDTLNEATGHVYNVFSTAINYVDLAINSTLDRFFIWYYKDRNVPSSISNVSESKIKSELELLKAQNEELRQEIHYIDNFKYTLVSTRIVSISASVFGKQFMVRAGKKDGVCVGHMVINEAGVVGRVIEVSQNFAKVLVIGNPNLRIPAVLIQSKKQCILVGNTENNDDLLLPMYLDDYGDVSEDELVVTMGEGSVIPDGIPIGRVTFVNKRLMVKPNVNLKNLSVVNIIIPVD